MNPWDVIGWAIALPLIMFSALFVFAVSVAVVRAIATGGKRKSSRKTANKPRLTVID
jgi:hypothetical protein